MKKYLFLVLFVFCSQVNASGFTGYGDVLDVHQRECSADKGFEITFVQPHLNPDTCANTSTIDLSCNHQAYETIVSMVLAAKISGKKVNFWVDGCGGDGNATVITARIQ